MEVDILCTWLQPAYRQDTQHKKEVTRKSCEIFIKKALDSGRWGTPRYGRIFLKSRRVVRKSVGCNIYKTINFNHEAESFLRS
jgi:hypothetical protein